MARADFAAEVSPVAVGREKPEDVGFRGGRRQIKGFGHSYRLSLRGIERTRLDGGEVAITRADVVLRQARSRAEKLFAQSSRRVVAIVNAAPLQLGNEMRDDVAEGLVGHGVGEIEA